MLLLAPALVVVVGLFGGGLFLGLLQGMGYFPGSEEHAFTFAHFRNVLADPDFLSSLGLTVYISVSSTVIAVVISIVLALVLLTLSERMRWVHFIVQVPLVIPHLVVAIAVMFLLSPTGLFSRMAQMFGLLNTSADFPLFINDRFGIGINHAPPHQVVFNPEFVSKRP